MGTGWGGYWSHVTPDPRSRSVAHADTGAENGGLAHVPLQTAVSDNSVHCVRLLVVITSFMQGNNRGDAAAKPLGGMGGFAPVSL